MRADFDVAKIRRKPLPLSLPFPSTNSMLDALDNLEWVEGRAKTRSEGAHLHAEPSETRYVLLQYIEPFTSHELATSSKELTENGVVASLKSSVYRISTLFSRFRHCRLAVLSLNSKYEWEGHVWHLRGEGGNAIPVDEEWKLEAPSFFAFYGVTCFSDSKITETGTTDIQFQKQLR